MTCANCGSAAVDIVDERGGTTSGSFVEQWECDTCGALGWIRGHAAAPPQQWSRTGRVFEE